MVSVKVGKLADFPEGEMRGLTVNGNEILIANVKGKVYAMHSVCTHEGGPLAEGELEEYRVTCPWHGAVFDVRTGKVLEAPAEKNEETFKVSIKGEEVFVEV